MKKIIYLTFLLSGFSLFSQVNLTSDLKVCMPFNGNASDVSGNGFNGSVLSATLTTDRFGNTNSAYQFNSAFNSGISVPTFSAMAPTNELTISMWAKADVVTSNCLFILDPDSQTDRCVGCAQYTHLSNSMMIWDYGSILSNGRSTYTNVPSDVSNWHHYVFIVSQTGNMKQMYCDGAIKINTTYGGTCTNKNKPFLIGGGYSNGTSTQIRWNGKIDDVCIYNRALNASEVAALYAGTGACFSVGIEELSGIEKGIIFPTVSETGIYNFSMKNLNNSTIQVYSCEGKCIRTYTDLKELNSTLNLSDFLPGLYIVKMVNGDKISVQKVIKN
jgi:hypothetical protein